MYSEEILKQFETRCSWIGDSALLEGLNEVGDSEENAPLRAIIQAEIDRRKENEHHN